MGCADLCPLIQRAFSGFAREIEVICQQCAVDKLKQDRITSQLSAFTLGGHDESHHTLAEAKNMLQSRSRLARLFS